MLSVLSFGVGVGVGTKHKLGQLPHAPVAMYFICTHKLVVPIEICYISMVVPYILPLTNWYWILLQEFLFAVFNAAKLPAFTVRMIVEVGYALMQKRKGHYEMSQYSNNDD